MKRITYILSTAIFLCVACEVNHDDNRTLEYDSIEVNFASSIEGNEWPEGAELGIIATCTRDGAEGQVMSESPVARYRIVEAGQQSDLVACSEADKAISLAGDHNFRFYGIYPYPGPGVDLESVDVSINPVQDYSAGVMSYLPFLSSSRVVTVLPPVNLNMKTMFSILSLYLPNDLREGLESTVKKLEIAPADESAFDGYLAQAGRYNAVSGVFTPDLDESSNLITVNFGDGLFLKDGFTRVDVAVAPFAVPEGGLSLRFTDVDGTETSVTVLSSEKEVGTNLRAGEGMAVYVSSISDGIVPVTFPVVFPLGYPDGDNTQTGYCSATNSWIAEWANDVACASATRLNEMWSGTHGKLLCRDQNQAYVTWTWADGINDTGIKHFIETSNTARYLISTFGVKGVWTGDYYEFTIPVRKFAAGSELQLTMPLYTRSGPTFWEVLYKDGDEWKSTAKDDLPAYPDAEVKARATWAIPYGGAAATTKLDTDQQVRMKFENEIKSGIISIRVKCVDGTIISTGDNAVSTVEVPYNSKGTAAAPCYFWNPSDSKRANQNITIELL